MRFFFLFGEGENNFMDFGGLMIHTINGDYILKVICIYKCFLMRKLWVRGWASMFQNREVYRKIR